MNDTNVLVFFVALVFFGLGFLTAAILAAASRADQQADSDTDVNR